MSKDNLEIERKFLLKDVPNIPEDEVKVLIIHQVYIKEDGVVKRYRMTADGGNRIYHECIKTQLGPGKFIEDEREVSDELFRDKLDQDHRYIKKTRHVYNSNGLRWEIDKYQEISLVVMEVEFESEDDFNNFNDSKIPEIIKGSVIIELTGKKEFSNYNLSIEQK